jgi:hypothetical protein
MRIEAQVRKRKQATDHRRAEMKELMITITIVGLALLAGVGGLALLAYFLVIYDSKDMTTNMNGNGRIDPDEREIMLEDRRRKMEDADAKRDAQRRMTWFALSGMVLYPSGYHLGLCAGIQRGCWSDC